MFLLPSLKDRQQPKCKSHSSRAAAYDLLVEMVKGSVENYRLLHNWVMAQHMQCKNLHSYLVFKYFVGRLCFCIFCLFCFGFQFLNLSSTVKKVGLFLLYELLFWRLCVFVMVMVSQHCEEYWERGVFLLKYISLCVMTKNNDLLRMLRWKQRNLKAPLHVCFFSLIWIFVLSKSSNKVRHCCH